MRVWAVLATVTDDLPEEARLRKLVGRLATYLQGYGEVLVRANGWDLAALQRFRDDPLVQGYPGAFDAVGTTEQLTYLRDEVLPAQWLTASATGSAADCAGRILDQLDAGADSVVLHGATPDELAPVLRAWDAVPATRPVRPPARQPRMEPTMSDGDGGAVGVTDVVAEPEGLTAAWLSAALGSTVTGVRAEPVGTGQIGTCFRLHLDGPGVGPGACRRPSWRSCPRPTPRPGR